MTRPKLATVGTAILAFILVLVLETALENRSRDELFEATRKTFIAYTEMTAVGISNGYFQWTELRDYIATDDRSRVEKYLVEIPEKYRYARSVGIERGEPAKAPYHIAVMGDSLSVTYPIADSDGGNILSGVLARVEVDAAAILEDVQTVGVLKLAPGAGKPFAYGLSAEFIYGPLGAEDCLIALFFGALAGVPVAILAFRHSRFFYQSRGLERIIFLFEQSERYSANHSRKVAEVAVFIGSRIGLRQKRLRDLYAAALLHDIGKISTPPEILLKPDSLDTEERESIKRHPEISANILANFSELAHLAEFVMRHHERIDGSGYPAGLSGGEIPLESRIIAIADVFEALTGERPYRAGVSAEEAFSIMGEEGLDPDLLDMFHQAFPSFEDYSLPRWVVHWMPSRRHVSKV